MIVSFTKYWLLRGIFVHICIFVYPTKTLMKYIMRNCRNIAYSSKGWQEIHSETHFNAFLKFIVRASLQFLGHV